MSIYGRKHCEERRNCLFQAISPFLTMFSTTITLVRQTAVLCCNGLIHHFEAKVAGFEQL